MTTLGRLMRDYVTGRRRRGELAARTARGVAYALGSLDRSFGSRPLTQLTPRAIERWLETVGHLSPSTRRNHLAAVRGFCRWLVASGLIESDPTEGVTRIRQPRSVPRALTVAELGRLWRALPDDRARAVVALMAGCGLRCVEVARLEATDYDPVGGTIRVRGKGGHERELPVPAAVRRVVDHYLGAVGGVTSGPLIRQERRRSQGLSAETLSTYVSRWMAAAELKVGRWDGRSAHALRHTAASDVLDACHDLRVVQEMLGHQHLSSTSIYLRRAGIGAMREAMEARPYMRDAS